MNPSAPHPIDRVLFETTEFCENQCSFCYGDYGPNGSHMETEDFSLFFGNLMRAGLLAPDSLIILFGGEILNHPGCLEICRAASEIKGPAMRLVLITSGKYREEYEEQATTLVDRPGWFHHWEISIKDLKSFRFGLRLLEKGHEVLFRYDFLNPAGLKKAMERFFQQVKICGLWKSFNALNPGLEKDLRYARKRASADTVIVEEFYSPFRTGDIQSVGLTFSPLDRSVMRKGGGSRTEAKCSLFDSQYRTAIHVTRDGTLYPCHLPRFRKRCEPLGNAGDMDFLRSYEARLQAFKAALREWRRGHNTTEDICVTGCRGDVLF